MAQTVMSSLPATGRDVLLSVDATRDAPKRVRRALQGAGMGEDLEHTVTLLATELVVPDQTFSSVTTIDLGDRAVELVHPGRGHTDGDLVVRLDDADVLLAGDLVDGVVEALAGPATTAPRAGGDERAAEQGEQQPGEQPADQQQRRQWDAFDLRQRDDVVELQVAQTDEAEQPQRAEQPPIEPRTLSHRPSPPWLAVRA